jgi:hypothetical protein
MFSNDKVHAPVFLDTCGFRIQFELDAMDRSYANAAPRQVYCEISVLADFLSTAKVLSECNGTSKTWVGDLQTSIFKSYEGLSQSLRFLLRQNVVWTAKVMKSCEALRCRRVSKKAFKSSKEVRKLPRWPTRRNT